MGGGGNPRLGLRSKDRATGHQVHTYERWTEPQLNLRWTWLCCAVILQNSSLCRGAACIDSVHTYHSSGKYPIFLPEQNFHTFFVVKNMILLLLPDEKSYDSDAVHICPPTPYLHMVQVKDSPSARSFKLWRSPRINSKLSIQPAYVALRAGTTTPFLLGSSTECYLILFGLSFFR